MKKLYPLIILTILFVLFHAYGIDRYPQIVVDEPWYASTAAEFAMNTHLKNIVVGERGGTVFGGFPIILGTVYKFFPISLFTGRMVTLFFGYLALCGFFLATKKIAKSTKVAMGMSILFMLSNITFVIARSLRPEIMISCVVCWVAYLLIEKKHPLLIGILLGLGCLSHALGILFAVSIVVFTLWKDRAQSLGLILGLTIVAISYFMGYYLMNNQGPLVMLTDILGSGRIVKTTSLFAKCMENLTFFFSSYSLGVKRLYIVVFEIFVLILGLRHREKNIRLLSFSGLFVLIVGLLFITPFISRYSVVTFTCALIVASVWLESRGGLILLGIYACNQLLGTGYFVYKNFNNTSYQDVSAEIRQVVKPNDVSIGLIQFYFPLQETLFHHDCTRWRMRPYDNIDGFLSSGDVDLIVLSDYRVSGKSTLTKENSVFAAPYDTIFYKKLYKLAHDKGNLIKTIPTKGFNDITVWRLDK